MAESNKPEPVNTGAIPSFNAQRFFEAIPGHREDAMALLRAQVPAEGPPTPRAEAYINNGEWDRGALVQLAFIQAQPCLGRVGDVTEGELVRFCGLRSSECTSNTHAASSTWKGFRSGWYIPGNKRKGGGFFRVPSLPSHEEGGPITPTIGRVLLSQDDPVLLSVGQWKFVIDEWTISNIAATTFGEEFTFDRTFMAQKASYPKVETVPFEQEGTTDEPTLQQSSDTMLNEPSSEPAPKSQESVNKPTKASSDTPVQQASIDPVLLRELDAMRQKVNFLVDDLKKTKLQNQAMGQRLFDLEKQKTPDESALQEAIKEVDHRLRVVEYEGTTTKAEVERLRSSAYDPVGEHNLLREQVELLKSQSKIGSGVERHGMRFSHPSEVAAVLRIIDGAIGIFHDVVSLLHSIGATTASHKATLAVMKAQKDVKISSDLAARVITSFRTNLPAIFYGGSASVEAVDEYVSLGSKLKTYAAWHHDDGVSGVSQRMVRGAIEIQQRVSFLSSQLTTDPAILRLSNGLLIDSVNFTQRMIAFIDSTYIEYKVTSYFTDAQIWELMVSFIEKIFEDLRAARCPIQDASESDPSMLLWGILKSHEVMDSYIGHDFKTHPSLNGILVQKILKSSPTAGMLAKITTVEKSVSTANSAVSSLKAKVANIEAKVAKV